MSFCLFPKRATTREILKLNEKVALRDWEAWLNLEWELTEMRK